MPNHSAMVLFSGESPIMGGDRLYDFYVNRNFYYTAGIDRENMIFTAVKTGDDVLFTLYIPRFNGQTARWVGANMTADEAKSASGIADIRFIDEFDGGVADMVCRHNVTEIYIDTDNRFNRTELTKGLAMITASAPSARALKTSTPVLIPPSTKIFIEPSTALTISSKTSAVAGH